MEGISLWLNHIEYRLFTVVLKGTGAANGGLKQEQIANAAIEYTHKHGVTVPLNRRDPSILQKYKHHRMKAKSDQWEFTRFKQVVLPITEENLLKLGEIKKKYSFEHNTETMSLCLRQLAAYCEENGTDIIENWHTEESTGKRVIYVPVRTKLSQEIFIEFSVIALRRGIEVEKVFAEVLTDHIIKLRAEGK
jgi:hypothetical protein